MRDFLVVSIMAAIVLGGISTITVLSRGDGHRIRVAAFESHWRK